MGTSATNLSHLMLAWNIVATLSLSLRYPFRTRDRHELFRHELVILIYRHPGNPLHQFLQFRTSGISVQLQQYQQCPPHEALDINPRMVSFHEIASMASGTCALDVPIVDWRGDACRRAG